MYTIIGYVSVNNSDGMCEVFSYDTEDLHILDSILWQNRYNFTFDIEDCKKGKVFIETYKDRDQFYCD